MSGEVIVRPVSSIEHGGNGREAYGTPDFAGFRYSMNGRGKIIVGESPTMVEVFERLQKVAADPYSSVLIVGESGTGKQLVSEAVHFTGPRREKPYVDLNCAAIPEALLESELFGHVKGAFTGAVRDKKGMFQFAHGGSIFLDEIHALPYPTQAKLLKAVDGGYIRPVGYDSAEPKEVDARVITATQKDLSSLVVHGEFRKDLLYRLGVCVIRLPCLKDRGEKEIEILAKYFMQEYNRTRKKSKELSADAIEALKKYSWPGNVRELANIIESVAVFTPSDCITGEDINLRLSNREMKISRDDLVFLFDETADLDGDFKRIEKALIEQRLRRFGGNQSKAAPSLGISRDALRYRMKFHGLLSPDGVGE